jgi:tRNA(Ile)-lysidine synthase
VELPGSVSVYRASLSQLEMEAASQSDGVASVAARCGKLVFRHSKNPQL